MLLIATFGLSKERIYLVWAIVFTYVLLDDALLIHQRLRDALGAHSHSTWNMGQLAVWILVAMILLVTTLASSRRAGLHPAVKGEPWPTPTPGACVCAPYGDRENRDPPWIK